MIISPAYAQAAAAGGPGILGQLLPFLLIFAVFYFLLIRPQQKRAKEHKNLVKPQARRSGYHFRRDQGKGQQGH